MLYPSVSLFAFMEYPSRTQSCSTFATKCSRQIVYMLINFAKVVVVDPCMLWACSCFVWLHDHVSCWQYAYLVMQCLVVSESSSQRGLHNSVFAISSLLQSLNLLPKLAMFTWVPSYLLILFGLWSVRDFCSMLWVDSCHAFVCYELFL